MSVYLRAECQDCPTSLNADWGHQERVHKEAVNESIVRAWAWDHVYSQAAKNAGTYKHRLTFSRVVRLPVDVEKLNPELLSMIFGEIVHDPVPSSA